MAEMARHHPVDRSCFSKWKIFPLKLLPYTLFGWMVPVWSRKGKQMKSLTTEQKQQLVEIVIEEFGTGMNLDDFTDALLGLLEDTPGFETTHQSTINKLTQQLWRKYHD